MKRKQRGGVELTALIAVAVWALLTGHAEVKLNAQGVQPVVEAPVCHNYNGGFCK